MKVEAVVKLVEHTKDADFLIEFAGRTAYQSKGKIEPGSSSDFVRKLMNMGHESVLEHAYATFLLANVSRALTHQLVRHRLVSYTQKSQRYVKEGDFDYVIPNSIANGTHGADVIFEQTMKRVQETYELLITLGIPKEDARFLLPNACTSEIVVTANFRQWRHMINLRCDSHAQWEIRGVFNEILKQLYKVCPVVFEDLKEKFE